MNFDWRKKIDITLLFKWLLKVNKDKEIDPAILYFILEDPGLTWIRKSLFKRDW